MKRILFSCVMIASALSFFSCKDEPEGRIKPHTFATTIKDAREFWVSGVTWNARIDSIEMTDTLIEGKPYLLMLRKGQRTNVCIRVERDRIFGYNPNDGSEFMMYDFSKKPSREEPLEVTLFFEHLDGSVEPLTYHADCDNIVRLDGDLWSDGVFHMLSYFAETEEKLTHHKIHFVSEDGRSVITGYTEYMGFHSCPLVITEPEIWFHHTHSYCYSFRVPGKGIMEYTEYIESNGKIRYDPIDYVECG